MRSSVGILFLFFLVHTSVHAVDRVRIGFPTSPRNSFHSHWQKEEGCLRKKVFRPSLSASCLPSPWRRWQPHRVSFVRFRRGQHVGVSRQHPFAVLLLKNRKRVPCAHR